MSATGKTDNQDWAHPVEAGEEVLATAGNMSSMPEDVPPAARLAFVAFTQAAERVYDRVLEQGCEPLLMAIAQRPESQEKFQRLQALEILNGRVERFAEQHDIPEMAASARVWMTLSRLTAKSVWGRLNTPDTPMPAPNETAVLVDFMDDAELMGILGLQPGWTPDLKVVDPNLDLKATDLDEGLS